MTVMLYHLTDMANEPYCDARRFISMGTTADTSTYGRQSYSCTFQRSSTATDTVKWTPTVCNAVTE